VRWRLSLAWACFWAAVAYGCHLLPPLLVATAEQLRPLLSHEGWGVVIAAALSAGVVLALLAEDAPEK
jgi:hypothetical protein